MYRKNRRAGLTIVETVACIAVAAVVLACTVAMTQDARDVAKINLSVSNLRNLATAQAIYAAEWNDRQFTLVVDDLATHGSNVHEALTNYEKKTGKPHPPIVLGDRTSATGQRVRAALDMRDADNQRRLPPIGFDAKPDGSFRMLNVANFNQYLSGRFFDPILYAPKDETPLRVVAASFDADPAEAPTGKGDLYWSSYSRSPAAMYDPDVLAAPEDAKPPRRTNRPGFHDPFSLKDGLRSPSFAQTLYPDLKTSMIEHHWLQNRPSWAAGCNEAILDGRYGGCEPYYFNHYAYSEPVSLFVDGHVAVLRVNDVLIADKKLTEQSGYGLWHRHPGDAADGYFESMAADRSRTSFHIFTTDGIRGRDKIR